MLRGHRWAHRSRRRAQINATRAEGIGADTDRVQLEHRTIPSPRSDISVGIFTSKREPPGLRLEVDVNPTLGLCLIRVVHQYTGVARLWILDRIRKHLMPTLRQVETEAVVETSVVERLREMCDVIADRS